MPDIERDFFVEVDSLASLIVHRYPSGIPSDVIDALDALSALARFHHREGNQIIAPDYLAWLRRRVAELTEELSAIERMGGEGL